MPEINNSGYIERITTSCHTNSVRRDWYFPKYGSCSKKGFLDLGIIKVPEKYMGKRLRFKVEVVK